MLVNLLLASLTVLLCFFPYFLLVPVEIEKERLNLALIIPTGAPMKVANDAMEMLPVVTDKTINDLSK